MTGVQTCALPIYLEVAKDGKSFNLAGQQVGKNYKGVVIKNGKKMVIK